MSSAHMKRIVWRRAKPIDVCLAANLGKALSQNKIDEFIKKFGHEIEKARPWGMVINDSTRLNAKLYSRTTSKNPDGKTKLSHDLHDSYDCGIDKEGVVELRKYVEMPRAFWESKQINKKSFNNSVFVLLCFCENPSCRKVDIEFLNQMDETYKNKEQRQGIL